MNVSQYQHGARANIVTSAGGEVEGIEFNGYLGKGFTKDDVLKMTQEIGASVISILDKLAG